MFISGIKSIESGGKYYVPQTKQCAASAHAPPSFLISMNCFYNFRVPYDFGIILSFPYLYILLRMLFEERIISKKNS